jgi:hypothetical protein
LHEGSCCSEPTFWSSNSTSPFFVMGRYFMPLSWTTLSQLPSTPTRSIAVMMLPPETETDERSSIEGEFRYATPPPGGSVHFHSETTSGVLTRSVPPAFCVRYLSLPPLSHLTPTHPFAFAASVMVPAFPAPPSWSPHFQSGPRLTRSPTLSDMELNGSTGQSEPGHADAQRHSDHTDTGKKHTGGPGHTYLYR